MVGCSRAPARSKNRFDEREAQVDEARFWAIIEAGGHKALADPERQLAAVHLAKAYLA